MKAGIPFPILLVDHDADDRFFMDEAFKRVGYEAKVKKFIIGAGLLRYLELIEPALYPSLIVLNDSLVGQNAEKTLSILKANQAYQKIPVIIYAEVVLPSRKEALLSIGAYDYIEKGLSMSEIVDIAQKLKQLAESAAVKINDNP